MIQIPYGLKDNKRVHISEVESGLACGVDCIVCGATLEAHKGNTLHYFKHKNKTSNCKTSFETLMHKIAKEIIKEHKQLMLPPVEIGEKRLYPERKIKIDKVELEHRLEGIIPDIVCTIQNRELLIEINVTNPLSAEKRKKIEELGLATIEISISKELIFSNPKEVETRIIYSTKNKKWIYNSKTIKFDKELIKYQEYLIDNSKIISWIVRGAREVKQVHCKNTEYFDKLIRGYKADLYRNCKKCKFYIGHNLQGVACIFGVDIKEFNYVENT